jgi:asparagine synthetase B (glutamine-hydrolysing)
VLFEISRDNIADGARTQQLPHWIDVDGSAAVVSGDRSAFRETFVWNTDERLLVSTTLEELLPRIGEVSNELPLSAYGLSHVLHHGFPPVPYTVFDGVSRLAPGDSATFSSVGDSLAGGVASDYPWRVGRSRQDQVPSIDKLRKLIAEAVTKQVESAGREGILMLSSGKDSVALAVALRDGGHTDVQCATFKSRSSDEEHVYAAALCERLGLEHHTIEMPRNPDVTRAAVLRLFEEAPIPSADQGTVPYAVVAHAAKLDRGALIDGGGNDAYMGHLLTSRNRVKRSLRIRNRAFSKLATKVTRHDSMVNYFARSQAAAFLPGRMFRDRETAQFYSGSEPTEDYWYDVSDDARELDMPDFLAVTKMRHTESARSNPKVYLTARSYGLEPLLPFCDDGIAEYYFNLPEASRFDRASRTNKILLREMLADAVGYDPESVGSNFFGFDGPRFLIENSGFVRDEILSCELWLPEIEGLLDGWLKALPSREFLFHSLLALFMISGWHNHSVFLDVNTVYGRK